MLAVYLLWPGFREAPGIEPCWKFVAFLVNLDIDYLRNTAFSHTWSLCRPSARRFAAVCLAAVVAGVALRSAVWLHDRAADPTPQRNWSVEDIYYPTRNRLDGLLCGVVLAAWKVYRPRAWARARRHSNGFLLAGIAVMALALWLFRDRIGLPGNAVGWPVLSLGLGFVVFAGAGRDSLIGRPLLRWRDAALTGNRPLSRRPPPQPLPVPPGDPAAAATSPCPRPTSAAHR